MRTPASWSIQARPWLIRTMVHSVLLAAVWCAFILAGLSSYGCGRWKVPPAAGPTAAGGQLGSGSGAGPAYVRVMWALIGSASVRGTGQGAQLPGLTGR